jgi:hypothetical protein
MENDTIVFAFDIETRGKSPTQHGILAVGVCIGDIHRNILSKVTWHVAPLPSGQSWETRCVEEFWSNQGNLMHALSTNQVPAERFAHEFRQLLDSFDAPGPGRRHLYLLSDNPTVDAGFINVYLDLFKLDSMQYGADGRTYRPVHDSDSYTRGANGSCFHDQWVTDAEDLPALGVTLPDYTGLVPHQPADDATRIYMNHVAVIKHA